jgi:hypothetical protein
MLELESGLYDVLGKSFGKDNYQHGAEIMMDLMADSSVCGISAVFLLTAAPQSERRPRAL